MYRKKLFFFFILISCFLFLPGKLFAANCTDASVAGTCIDSANFSSTCLPPTYTGSSDTCPTGQQCCISSTPSGNPPGGGAAPATSNFTYTLLEPIPGCEQGSSLCAGDLPTYLQALYRFAFWAIGIAALFMLSVGGFMYVTSAGNTSRMGTAKTIIADSLLGLVLALVAWLVLYIINPDLVKIKLPVLSVQPTLPPTTGGPPADCAAANGFCFDNASFSATCLAAGYTSSPATCPSGQQCCVASTVAPPTSNCEAANGFCFDTANFSTSCFAPDYTSSPATCPSGQQCCVATTTAPPATGNLTDADARGRLSAAGITVKSSGNCSDQQNPSCTSLEQIPARAIDKIIALKKGSGCTVIVTGGTEVGHQTHGPGLPVMDIENNSCLDNYIIANQGNFRSTYGVSNFCVTTSNPLLYQKAIANCLENNTQAHYHLAF